MSFFKGDGTQTVGDVSGQTVSGFVAANGGWDNPSLRFTLRLRTTGPLWDPNANIKGAILTSIRCGNTGQIIEDGYVTGGSTTFSNVPTGFQGATEPMAWRGAKPSGSGPRTFADLSGGLTNNDASFSYADQHSGVAWIAPSGRIANPASTPAVPSDMQFAAGAEIKWAGSGGWSGLSVGYKNGSGRVNALDDLLGMWGDRTGYAGLNSGGTFDGHCITEAGQIFAKDSGGNVLKINNLLDAGNTDPRNKNNDVTDYGWNAIPLDLAFAKDMFVNPENKGIAFSGLYTRDWQNTLSDPNLKYYTKEQDGGIWAPYLEVSLVPEPAAMGMVAVGSLALLRRRRERVWSRR